MDTARNMKSPNFILLNSYHQKNLFLHSAIFLAWQTKIVNQKQPLVCAEQPPLWAPLHCQARPLTAGQLISPLGVLAQLCTQSAYKSQCRLV